MNTVKLALVGALVLGLTAAAWPDEQKGGPSDIQQKLVGKWEVVKFTGKKGGPPLGAIFEFTRDGKVVATAEENGEKSRKEANYKVEGRGLTLTGEPGDKEEAQTLQVVKVDDKELVLRHEKEGVQLTLRRRAP